MSVLRTVSADRPPSFSMLGVCFTFESKLILFNKWHVGTIVYCPRVLSLVLVTLVVAVFMQTLKTMRGETLEHLEPNFHTLGAFQKCLFCNESKLSVSAVLILHSEFDSVRIVERNINIVEKSGLCCLWLHGSH